MENAWIYAGGAAAITAIAAFWGYIRGFFQQLVGRVIVSFDGTGAVQEALTCYLWTHCKRSPFSRRSYCGWWLYVRPKKRRMVVGMEGVGTNQVLFWYGWAPLWVTCTALHDQQQATPSMDASGQQVTVTYLRGTLKPEQLLIAALDTFNKAAAGTDDSRRYTRTRRYYIRHVHGTAGRMTIQSGREFGSGDSPVGMATSDTGNIRSTLQHRILQWHRDDLGAPLGEEDPLSLLALSAVAEQLVAEAERWFRSEDWYRERGLSWRRNWLLHGAPGTGKTSLVRALSQHLDLPVFSYDLATLYNDELRNEWSHMMSQVPCVALIEDIDGVFHDRKNVSGDGLTFDCLLNCIDGVERADGVLLVVTTNNPETLSPALGRVSTSGVCDEQQQRMTTRPGRIDRIVELRNPPEAGRRKMASRILVGCPAAEQERLIQDGKGDTGAQFENRCSQYALGRYWDDRKIDQHDPGDGATGTNHAEGVTDAGVPCVASGAPSRESC